MRKELAETLEQIIPESYVYPNYSGRGMFGEKTTGLIVKSELSLIRDLIANEGVAIEFEDGELENLNIDNFGLSYIVY